MSERSYRQFCPVAMAAEILCRRWTIVLLRELMAGSTRFNELRRGLPRMSPALLSQRLKELEEAGIVTKDSDGEQGDYRLTDSGRELQPLVEGFGRWGQRWVSSRLSLQNLDASLLMWDMRRNLEFNPAPTVRKVIQFQYPDAPAKLRNWWLIVAPGMPIEMCMIDPGHDVDLFVTAELRAMTAVWMGLDSVTDARAEQRLMLTGDSALANSMESWLRCSPFAGEKRMVA